MKTVFTVLVMLGSVLASPARACTWWCATCDNRYVCLSDAMSHYRYLSVGGGRVVIVSQAVGPVACSDGSTYHAVVQGNISGRNDQLEVVKLILTGDRGDVLVLIQVWDGYGHLV